MKKLLKNGAILLARFVVLAILALVVWAGLAMVNELADRSPQGDPADYHGPYAEYPVRGAARDIADGVDSIGQGIGKALTP